MAKAFSHKPSFISSGDDFATVKHNGQLPGFLYVVSALVEPDDVSYLPNTAQTHWQAQRDLILRFECELPVDDPGQLSDDETMALHKEMRAGTPGFLGISTEE